MHSCTVADVDSSVHVVLATVKIRERGRKLVGQPVRGDLEEHSLWNAGVKQAYAFMQDRDKCPTDALLVSRIQRRRAL